MVMDRQDNQEQQAPLRRRKVDFALRYALLDGVNLTLGKGVPGVMIFGDRGRETPTMIFCASSRW